MTCSLLVWRGGLRYVGAVIFMSCLLHIALLDVGRRSGAQAAPSQPQAPKLDKSEEHQRAPADGSISNNSKQSHSRELHKTADLVPLINETLKINNKTVASSDAIASSSLDGGKQSLRDEWTFDRVEYDLMEFLQELNARYQHSANATDQAAAAAALASAPESLEQRRNHPVPSSGLPTIQPIAPVTGGKASAEPVAFAAGGTSLGSSSVVSASHAVGHESVTESTIEQVKKELDLVAPKKLPAETAAAAPGDSVAATTISTVAVTKVSSSPSTLAAGPTAELPVSLASGDHDISESTWQYGIFDRFTRPRSSTTTTPSPADSLAASATNPSLDVRTFNSEECGLRSYRVEPDYFPGSGDAGIPSQLDTDEISKELSQRRQRPPPGAPFLSSHKKYPSSAAGDAARDELHDRDKPSAAEAAAGDATQYDRYGDPSYLGAQDAEQGEFASRYPTEKRRTPAGGAATAASSLVDDDSPAGDSEFNLALRRQWMQQQLGSTLQILGYNATSNATQSGAQQQQQPAGDFFKQQAYSMRENMMKMSGGGLGGGGGGGASGNKLVRSYVAGAAAAAAAGSPASSLNERELKARQDELKLEARVIGGNDARLGDSPWSASLQALVSRPGTGGVEYRHYCGGTIISEHYILTAAHCLDFMVGRESRLFVVIGDLNWRMSTSTLYGRRFGIEKLIIHGGYKSTAFGHDIGLIKTKESMRPLKVNGRYITNSVCLPDRNVEHTGEAELVGWGLFSNRNEMADSLQIADVPILPRPLCVDLYRRRTGLIQWLIGIELITDKQICAGTFGRGICQGDSGSALVYNEKQPAVVVQEAPATPLEVQPDGKSEIRRLLRGQLVRDHQQRATIIGTVAFGGIRRCSYQSLPGVYMQTSKYLDWILPRIQA